MEDSLSPSLAGTYLTTFVIENFFTRLHGQIICQRKIVIQNLLVYVRAGAYTLVNITAKSPIGKYIY